MLFSSIVSTINSHFSSVARARERVCVRERKSERETERKGVKRERREREQDRMKGNEREGEIVGMRERMRKSVARKNIDTNKRNYFLSSYRES